MAGTGRLLASSALAALLAAQTAHAQGDAPPAATETGQLAMAASDSAAMDAIIVRGQKVERTLQDTVASVAVYDNEEIEKQNFINLFDILDQTANVTAGFDDSVFSIRGIRNQGAGLGDSTSDVSTIYVDGVFLPSSLFTNGALNLWDIGSVEVFRGPQSTIQGRNALAGAIVINTIDPSFEFEGRGQVSYAENSTWRTSAAVSVPIIEDQFALRLTADYAETDGFVENPTLGRSDSAAADVRTLRAKALITPRAVPNLTVRLGYTHVDDTAAENRVDEDLFPEQRVNFENVQSESITTADIASVEFSYDIGDAWSLTAVSGYVESEVDFLIDSTRDEDGRETASTGLNDDRIFSQELRAVYEGNRLTGLVGAYYFNRSGGQSNDSVSVVESNFAFPDPRTIAGLLFGADSPVPLEDQIAIAAGLRNQVVGLVPEFDVGFIRSSDIDIENVAFFGEVSYAFTDRLSVKLGARYDRETIEQNVFDNTIVPPFATFNDPVIDGLLVTAAEQFSNEVLIENIENDFSAFLPKAVITYDWTDNLSTSLSYQRAYRAGGLSINTFRAALAPADAGQDDLEAAGIVNSFEPEFTNNYEFSLRSQWFDNRLTLNANAFFIDYTDQQVLVQLSPNPLDRLTDNVGQSELFGFELEAFAAPVDGLEISANLGFTDTEFTDGGDVLDTVDNAELDLTGLEFSYAPRWTTGASIRYTLPSGVFGNVRLRYTDETFALTDNNPTAVNDAYATLDLIAGYDAERFRAELFVTNVTDEEYFTFNPGDPNRGAVAVVGDPRVIGGRILVNV